MEGDGCVDMTVPSLKVQIQGQGIVSADNFNTYEQTCDNVANLRAFIGSTGLQVYMRGFVTPGDGGQGQFYWSASGTGPDDNGINFIVPNGAALGCWTRLTGGDEGTGTVTEVSVVTANGISGTVATPFTTPAITLEIDTLSGGSY